MHDVRGARRKWRLPFMIPPSCIHGRHDELAGGLTISPDYGYLDIIFWKSLECLERFFVSIV